MLCRLDKMNGNDIIEYEEKNCSRLRQEFLKYKGVLDWDLEVDLSCDETLLDNPNYEQFVITDMAEFDLTPEQEDYMLEAAREDNLDLDAELEGWKQP